MKIAYSQLPAKPDAVFPNRQSVGRPIAPLLLEKHGKMLSVLAIVDSGADQGGLILEAILRPMISSAG
jgi:hypothetical protein